jgi:hypothetical protein
MRLGKNFSRHAASLFTVLLFSAAPALADILVHNSQEDYYDSGGTLINNLLPGGGQRTVGDTSGDVLWEVGEKGFYDSVTNVTRITYTVFNDTFEDDITSFHVPFLVTPLSITQGPDADWSGNVAGGYINWQTSGTGIAPGESKDTFQLFYEGNVAIGFCPGVYTDLGSDHIAVRGENWEVSCAVPTPGAALLGLMGLGLVGRMKRKLA